MAQSVEYPNVDFGSGHDLTVCESEPLTGFFTDSAEPTWNSLSLPLSAPPSLVLSLSLKVNK